MKNSSSSTTLSSSVRCWMTSTAVHTLVISKCTLEASSILLSPSGLQFKNLSSTCRLQMFPAWFLGYWVDNILQYGTSHTRCTLSLSVRSVLACSLFTRHTSCAPSSESVACLWLSCQQATPNLSSLSLNVSLPHCPMLLCCSLYPAPLSYSLSLSLPSQTHCLPRLSLSPTPTLHVIRPSPEL